METNSQSYRLLKNLSYSMVGFLWPLIFSIFITPVVVKRLGTVDYGVFILVGTISAFLSLLDLGLTAAMVKYVSENYVKNNFREIQRLINFGNANYFFIGLLGLGVYWLLGAYFLNIFHIIGVTQRHISLVFILGGLIFFVNSVNSVFSIIPQALQRYDIITKLNLIQVTFSSLAMLILVLNGFQLKAILAFNLGLYAAVSLLFRWYAVRLMKEVRFGIAWDKELFKKLYGFGIFAAIANITNNALQQFDRLFIPAFLGPTQLAYYSLAGSVASKNALVVGSLSNVFFPMSSSLLAEGKTEKLSEIYRRIIRNLTVFSAAITAAILLFANKILLYWLDKDFADQSTGVLIVLSATFFILSIYGTLYHFLLGLGKVKFLAAWSTFMAALNVLLLFIFVPRFGILGAAWAYFIATLPLFVMFYWVEKYFLNLEGILKFYFRLFGKIGTVSAIFYLFIYYVVINRVHSLVSLVFFGPMSVILFLVLYKICGFFEAEDEDLIWSFILQIKNKFKPIKAI